MSTEQTTRTDADGTWHSTDGGQSWLLTEPSQAWRDARSGDDPLEPNPLAEIAATLPAATLEEVNDLLAQVISTLGEN